MNINRPIQAYYSDGTGEHHRYRSWEHCYTYFRTARRRGLRRERDHGALQLAFYLASWGMYRGSSFLLQHTYTVHRGVIDLVADSRYDALWRTDFGTGEADVGLIPVAEELIHRIRGAYHDFVPADGSGRPTDTLITKILLGTFGCLPACDRYFIEGLKSQGLSYSYLNTRFVERVLAFCQEHLDALLEEQTRIERISRVRYPVMKLVDMCFWQIGYERSTRR
jgi:hypothetical protein